MKIEDSAAKAPGRKMKSLTGAGLSGKKTMPGHRKGTARLEGGKRKRSAMKGKTYFPRRVTLRAN